ncbi:hypothetical protein NQ318_022090 [Aromia moschata]|uniref:Uncharacterized protein n=1 Tax=Aromia moschata TaxID=1265417 RepID=A0AAV8Z853_9CUCU|nr:hypothetical protein NQ318_022090 [Aromia moschata]
MDEEWDIECSDEEYKNCKGPWSPRPEEIDQLYTMLEKGEMQDLHWKCPVADCTSPQLRKSKNRKPEEQSDFDFMGEVTSLKLKIRNKGEETLKGSAKKKTASLDGVINNMRRHNLLSSKTK